MENHPILNKLYESNGRDKQIWLDLLSILNTSNSSESDSYNDIINFFNEKIKNEPSNPLTLDIIDFLIDFGPINLIREISKIEFMNNVFNLLKNNSGSGLEVQRKGIYLTKKWSEKKNEFPNETFEGFMNNYDELNNSGISPPPPGFKLETYEQYITQSDINNMMNANMRPIQNPNNNLNNNFDNINDINNNFNGKGFNNNNNIMTNENPNIDAIFNKTESEINSHSIDDNMNSNNNMNNNINNMKNSNNMLGLNNEGNNNQNEENNFKKYENEFPETEKDSNNPFEELNKKEIKFPNDLNHNFSNLKDKEADAQININEISENTGNNNPNIGANNNPDNNKMISNNNPIQNENQNFIQNNNSIKNN